MKEEIFNKAERHEIYISALEMFKMVNNYGSELHLMCGMCHPLIEITSKRLRTTHEDWNTGNIAGIFPEFAALRPKNRRLTDFWFCTGPFLDAYNIRVEKFNQIIEETKDGKLEYEDQKN